jgi:superfamily II DNA or RNA helicase
VSRVHDGWAAFHRQIIVQATGTGKTVTFSEIASEFVKRGQRVLILAHSDELLEQAIAKLHRVTGLHAEKEKADERASPDAMVVVGSVQTLARTDRLMGWNDDHFGLVIVDECHRSLAVSYQKVLRYFHWGSDSLIPDWKPDPAAVPKCRILGVTATADRGDKRSLGEFYQACAYEYGLVEAVHDGYLVRPIVKNVPLKIDLRGIHVTKSANGGDLDASELAERLTPFLKEIARNIAIEARDRKSVVFMPSIATAKILAESLVEHGIAGSFVSGNCPDRHAKLEAFAKVGRGSAICNAMLLTEGWDQPDVDCIVNLRPTKIRSLYTQMVGRGTRTLTGLIDKLDTASDRVAAIAASAKPNVLILDFPWVSDRLDLVKPVDLVLRNPKARDEVPEGTQGDLLETAEKAERDLLASLAKELAKHSKKKARTIDPLKFNAVATGFPDVSTYSPSSNWDAQPADEAQLRLLADNKIDASKIKSRGEAKLIIDWMLERQKLGLASPKQLSFMIQLGVPESHAASIRKSAAGAVISRQLQQKQARRKAAA